jgi:anti-sigma B factor antagonist
VEIDIGGQSAVKIIKLRGRLTLGESVDRLRNTMEGLLNSGDRRFVVDLGEVQMIDSSGIGLLVRLLTTAKQQGGALKLLNPSKFAVQTLKMIGLLNQFEIFQEEKLAVDSFA